MLLLGLAVGDLEDFVLCSGEGLEENDIVDGGVS
jgi:hypothetical protein